MNLKQLQFALHVAETHSFSRAAELSFVTQPTLSNAISQLEEELGGRLFNRTTRKVDLTSFGEYILPHIRAVLQERQDLLSAAESYHNPTHKILRIGFSPLVDMRRIDQFIKPFQEKYPTISFFFKECFVGELHERLNSEQIDLKIVPAPSLQAEESVIEFYHDNLYYLPAQSDGSSKRISYELADLPDTAVILTGGGCGLNLAVEKLFAQQGITFNAYPGQAMSYSIIEDWASLGIGAGILPHSKISENNRSILPLFLKKDEPAKLHFSWSWNSTQQPSQHILDFISYIKSAPRDSSFVANRTIGAK